MDASTSSILEGYKEPPKCGRKVAAELSKPVDKKALELMAAAWEKVAAERERRIKESGPQD